MLNYPLVIFFVLAGCAGTTININPDDLLIRGARLAGISAKTYLKMQLPPDRYYLVQRFVKQSESLVKATSGKIELGDAIGEIVAYVQAFRDEPLLGEYGPIVVGSVEVMFEAVNLNWEIPEEYEKARSIVLAFLDGMSE